MTPTCEFRPVRRIARTEPVLNEPMAAKISTAARVDITTFPTTPEKATKITAIHIPEKIAAHRPRAPAVTFNEVWPTDPPTGWPRKTPASTLPTPSAMKS